MSRVGKRPIEIPAGVTVDYQPPVITVKGSKITLKRTLPPKASLKIDGQIITVSPDDETREARAMWGLTRSLVANMVEGVHTGFIKELEIVGVGYRADLKGDTLTLNLGYSHPVEFSLPEGITATVNKQNRIVIKGADKELVGLTAARIRALRKPEPYKGKGVRYAGEVIRRKVGKTGVKQG
ncbi:MAG: 50S ribosomal protein L6 [Deltaproteobacteria bacterium]|nr:50S ribosomal protein L6 [Deltaproteobacteria bacterium]MBW2051737.1 50S ribosomal protein L6 [Deltaproteobacteria bacterium]MBW2140276.1 50S ribosomal protein L6 [Deltaproteobacteria bacterium]MBW2322119.1 50S ribosomal protein L6 [Deltaproteobacteria bacterium]